MKTPLRTHRLALGLALIFALAGLGAVAGGVVVSALDDYLSEPAMATMR